MRFRPAAAGSCRANPSPVAEATVRGVAVGVGAWEHILRPWVRPRSSRAASPTGATALGTVGTFPSYMPTPQSRRIRRFTPTLPHSHPTAFSVTSFARGSAWRPTVGSVVTEAVGPVQIRVQSPGPQRSPSSCRQAAIFETVFFENSEAGHLRMRNTRGLRRGYLGCPARRVPSWWYRQWDVCLVGC